MHHEGLTAIFSIPRVRSLARTSSLCSSRRLQRDPCVSSLTALELATSLRGAASLLPILPTLTNLRHLQLALRKLPAVSDLPTGLVSLELTAEVTVRLALACIFVNRPQ